MVRVWVDCEEHGWHEDEADGVIVLKALPEGWGVKTIGVRGLLLTEHDGNLYESPCVPHEELCTDPQAAEAIRLRIRNMYRRSLEAEL